MEWKYSRERQLGYARRSPEETSLYRIVYHYREELGWSWEERFQAEYGALRDEVLEALDAYLNCGIVAHGCGRAYCAQCKHSELIAFSCKKRGICPSCEAKRAIIFAEVLHERILAPVPNRHIVFSIPKILRAYFRYDRSLHSLLFQAAWESLQEWFQTQTPGFVPGAVFSIQTAGASLNHNPHLHGILSSGAFGKDGSFVESPTFDLSWLTARFQEILLALMLEQQIIDQSIPELIYSWSHSGFNVWVGDPIPADDDDTRRFIARYIDRGPVALNKIEISDDIITYHTDDEFTHEFDPVEFLARISVHIPNKWEQTVRYFGWYSARTRGARKEHSIPCVVELSPSALGESKKPSPTWAALIKKIYQVDPLTCPKCNAKMKIVAFIVDPKEVQAIAKNLGVLHWRAPPPLTASSSVTPRKAA